MLKLRCSAAGVLANILKEEGSLPRSANPLALVCAAAKEVRMFLLAKPLKDLQPHASGAFQRPAATPAVL